MNVEHDGTKDGPSEEEINVERDGKKVGPSMEENNVEQNRRFDGGRVCESSIFPGVGDAVRPGRCRVPDLHADALPSLFSDHTGTRWCPGRGGVIAPRSFFPAG